MRNQTHDVLALTTEVLTWISSGATAGTISSAIRDRNEVLVSSSAAVSSGNGHYYLVTPMPATPGWYVNEWLAVVNASTYANRQFLKVVKMETD